MALARVWYQIPFLTSSDGMVLFEEFLKSEFSEENIQFWRACEEYKKVAEKNLYREAQAIFDDFISQTAPKLVSV